MKLLQYIIFTIISSIVSTGTVLADSAQTNSTNATNIQWQKNAAGEVRVKPADQLEWVDVTDGAEILAISSPGKKCRQVLIGSVLVGSPLFGLPKS